MNTKKKTYLLLAILIVISVGYYLFRMNYSNTKKPENTKANQYNEMIAYASYDDASKFPKYFVSSFDGRLKNEILSPSNWLKYLESIAASNPLGINLVNSLNGIDAPDKIKNANVRNENQSTYLIINYFNNTQKFLPSSNTNYHLAFWSPNNKDIFYIKTKSSEGSGENLGIWKLNTETGQETQIITVDNTEKYTSQFIIGGIIENDRFVFVENKTNYVNGKPKPFSNIYSVKLDGSNKILIDSNEKIEFLQVNTQ